MKKHATVTVNTGYILPRLETICFHLDMAQASIEKLNRHVEHINQETVDQLNDIASEIKSSCNRFATYLRKQEPLIAEIEAGPHEKGKASLPTAQQNGERRPKCKTCVHCDRESWTCDVGRAGGVLMRPQNFHDIDIESPACRFYEKKGVRNGH